MIKRTILIAFLAALSLSSYGADCPLKGTWKSDKKKTLPHLYGLKNIDTKTRSRLSRMLGKIVIEYKDCTEFAYEFDGQTTTSRFEVLSFKNGVLSVRTEGEEQIYHVHFEDDCYYTIAPPLYLQEYYCRI